MERNPSRNKKKSLQNFVEKAYSQFGLPASLTQHFNKYNNILA